MAIRINTNVDALDAQRHLSQVGLDFSSAVAKLSSGLRINSAADDAAGLAISEKLKTQINGFDQGSRNAQDAISMVQTGESALNTTTSILQRMRQLAVQASNDTYTSSDRQNIQAEINQLIQEVDRIAQQTDFNTKKLLDGSAGGAQVQGGGPDIKAINAQAQVAIAGQFGIIGVSGTGIVAPAAASTTFQAQAAGGGFDAAATGLSIGGPGSAGSQLVFAAGDGTTYTMTLNAAANNGTSMTITGQGGRNDGYSVTIQGTGSGVAGVAGNQISDLDIENAIKNLPGGEMNAYIDAAGNLTINDKVGGTASLTPGAPQSLQITTATNAFVGLGFTAGTAVKMVKNNALANGGAAALTVNAANPLQVASGTVNATRSAVESANAISGLGSLFTQLSSITVQGGLGEQTFTAQAGESLETFVQQVNGSGIGVTMGVDQNTGKMMIYNNNYGIRNAANSQGANIVAVSAATGDFAGGVAPLPGQSLNMGFDTNTSGSVNSSLTYSSGVAAVNASITIVDPTNLATTANSANGNGYRVLTAVGVNSDQIVGTAGLSGQILTLANPGNIQGGDSYVLKQNSALNFQVGANANQTVNLQIDATNSQTLGVTSLDVLTTSDAETAISQLDRAIQNVSATRANMGAVINRLTNSMNNDMSAGENASSAQSRIADVNVAQETVQFTRDQILLQAGTAVLAQANQAPTAVLSLLR